MTKQRNAHSAITRSVEKEISHSAVSNGAVDRHKRGQQNVGFLGFLFLVLRSELLQSSHSFVWSAAAPVGTRKCIIEMQSSTV